MQRLYNVGVLSRDVIQKCRESSSTVFSSESSVVASSSSSTQNNSILPNSNNGSENGDDHSLFHHQHPQLRHRVVCPHQIQYYRKQVKLQVHRLEMAKEKRKKTQIITG